MNWLYAIISLLALNVMGLFVDLLFRLYALAFREKPERRYEIWSVRKLKRRKK